jgi:hypothetical protein
LAVLQAIAADCAILDMIFSALGFSGVRLSTRDRIRTN